MREIKFEYMLFDKDGNFLVKRVFDLSEIEASYFDMALTIHPDATADNQFTWDYDRHKTIRRQYTNLKDKNGKPIFEGDYVYEKVIYGYSDKSGDLIRNDYYRVEIKEPLATLFVKVKSYDQNNPEEVYYESDLKRSKIPNGIVINCFKSEDIEIIGNIYENGDLLP
jgi:uncharacterized phage protein (TIGR01671 family)